MVDDRWRDISGLVHQWGEQAPDAPAVRAGDETISYRRLDELGDRYARQLARLRLPTGSPVGVLMERSVHLPAVLVGTLRAGLSYVYLDPTQHALSPERVATECGVRLVCTDPGESTSVDVGQLPTLVPDPLRQVAPDAAGPAWAEPPADQLACLLYPSDATTGPAAPVALTRGGLAASLSGMAERLPVEPGDRFLAAAPLAAGRPAVELLLPLAAGAELLLATAEQARDARRLIEVIEQLQPTLLPATPSVWRNLFAAGWTGAPGLTAICDGEDLPRSLAGQLLGTTRRVIHCYGLVEVGGYACSYELGPGREPGPVPIGAPLPGLTACVADEQRRPVPDGAIGELWLAGPQLAAGNRGDPGLAGQRFGSAPDGWPVPAGTRLLRTGDLARFAPDRALEFHGRPADRLGHAGAANAPTAAGPAGTAVAVERLLAGLPGVAGSAAVPGIDRAGQPVLLAHLVADPAAETGADAVRHAAVAATADVPVPVQVLLCPRLPLTTSGRVNRAALPDPFRDPPGRAPQPVRSEEEQTIARIWTQLLGVEVTTVDDDFFDLGGQSLAVLRLAGSLEEAFGLPVQMADLFARTTVAAQAGLVEELYERLLTEVLAGAPATT